MLGRREWRSVAALITSSDAAAAVRILPSRRLAASLSSFKWSAWRIGAAADIWGLAELLNSPAKVSECVEHQCNLLKELIGVYHYHMSAYHDDTLENWYSANRSLNLDEHVQ